MKLAFCWSGYSCQLATVLQLDFALMCKKYSKVSLCGLLVCSLASVSPAESAAPDPLEHGFLLCPAEGPSVFQKLQEIENSQVSAGHIFPPSSAIVTFPEASEPDWAPCRLTRGAIDSLRLRSDRPETLYPALAWNEEFKPSARPPGPQRGEKREDPNRRAVDALIPDILSVDSRQKVGPSFSPGFNETSEYMMGTVAVGVFLLESSGSSYNWTSTEISQTVNGVYAAMEWWRNRGGAAANLSFVYEVHYQLPISYEPIQMDHADEDQWISEAMTSLGYEGGAFHQVRSYNNDLRQEYNTDWAFSIFIVDSSSSINQGRFPNGTYAWAYLGGPWISMSRYSSWAYNWQDYFRAVPAHETGHIFYATDEYDSMTTYSGYLNSRDDNEAFCLMNQNTLGLCSFTPLQIGWRDSDSDNVHDILDTQPETSLESYVPNPSPPGNLFYSGIATVQPYPNSNPFGSRNDVTINTVVGVEYRVNGGAWNPAIATDGAFDEAQEEYTFSFSTTGQGSYLVEARAVNSVGNLDLSPATDQVEILSSFSLDVVTNGDGSVVSDPPGINCGTDCNGLYPTGTSVTLTAAAGPGSIFVGWSGDGECTSSNECTLILSEDALLTATFYSCHPPASGDWIVTESCEFTHQAAAPADVIVEPGVVLTIAPGAILEIDLHNQKLLVKDTGGVLVQDGGTIRQTTGTLQP